MKEGRGDDGPTSLDGARPQPSALLSTAALGATATPANGAGLLVCTHVCEEARLLPARGSP